MSETGQGVGRQVTRQEDDVSLAQGQLVRIGGIVPFTTIDWPGALSCVAFLLGCPWNCPYCQNAALRRIEVGTLDERALFELLEQRHGLLDGVVLSGGEPLAQPGVVRLAEMIVTRGFGVALHTAGSNPARLRAMLPYLSWVGFDVKAPWADYERITGVAGSGEMARESLRVLMGSGLAMEARTTWHPALLTGAQISAMGHMLADFGVRSWALQAYRSQGTTGELVDETVYPADVPADVPDLFDHFEFRRA